MKFFTRLLVTRQLVFELAAVVLVGLTPLAWFGFDSIILGHDSGLRLDYLVHFQRLFYSWYPLDNFGFDLSLYKGFLITQLPELFFWALVPWLSLAQRLAFSFWSVAMGMSMYGVMRFFYREQNQWFIRVFSSWWYMTNFFVLQAWFIAERAKFSVIVALPLIFLLVWLTYSSKISLLKSGVLFGLIMFVFNGGGSVPLFGSLLLVCGVLWLQFLSLSFKQRKYGKLLTIAISPFIFAFFWAVFNSYWLLPHINFVTTTYQRQVEAAGGITGVMEWERTISQFASFDRLLRFQGIPDWYNRTQHQYARDYIFDSHLVILSFLPTFFIISWLRLIRKKWLQRSDKTVVLPLLVTWMITLFLMAGSRPPLGFLIRFAFLHVPGFVIFRSLFYKFGAALWFVGGWLTALAFFELTQKLPKRSKIGFRILALYALLFFHSPFFSGRFFEFEPPFSTRVSIPNYVTDVANYLETNPGTDRVLLLPPFDTQGRIEAYSWGYFSFDLLLHHFISVPIVVNDLFAPPILPLVYDQVSQNPEQWARGLNKLGITHAVVRHDAQKNVYEQNQESVSSALLLEKAYQNLPVFESGLWSVYELGSPSPEVFAQTAYIASNMNSSVLEHDEPVLGLEAHDTAFLTQVQAERVEAPDDTVLTAHIPRSYGPGHPLYVFSVLKSRFAAPKTQIDKTLFDVVQLASHSREYSKALKRYQDSIIEITQLNDDLSPKARSQKAISLHSFLSSHSRYLEPYRNTHQELDQLFKWLQDLKEELKKEAWYSYADDEFVFHRYWLSLPKTSTYVLTGSATSEATSLKLNGQLLETSLLNLEAGEHKLELSLSKQEQVEEEPELLAVSTKLEPVAQPPRITTEKISPTFYKIQVEDAPETPYLLVLKQRFNPLWSLSEDGAQQVEVDAFAQGWIVQKPGSYTLSISFQPQRVFYIGIVVSAVSIFLASIWITTWSKKLD